MGERSFFTDSEIEVPSVTANQMREIDRIAVEETGPNLYQMMENAGRNLAIEVVDFLQEGWQKSNILILAGGGGNGGGGICAGRHLVNRNISVTVCLASIDRLTDVTAYQRSVFLSANGHEITTDMVGGTSPDIVVDALIGYGLKAEPQNTTKTLIEWTHNRNVPVISLDIPSGIDATTGGKPGAAINPIKTVTLALPKSGLSRKNSGELILADIGISAVAFRRAGIDYKSPFGDCYLIPLRSG